MYKESESGRISASLMCAGIKDLVENIHVLEKENVEYLHVDVMDGEFVPNLGFGMDYINGVREMTEIPLDMHLMIMRPEDKLEWMKLREQDRVIIHYESTIHVQRTLVRAKSYGCTVMLAINPGTPVYSVEEVLDYIDGITILTVNPGFAGQKIVRSCISKVEKMEKFLRETGYSDLEIQVDGNISYENAKIFKKMGADLFVAGSSSIFDGGNLKENIRKYREAVCG